ncbi:MAG: 50S ribosomal protein L40e [Planctomycetota bacterium]|nr:MAG: 50S ribosomal protein L40e [Planctomycetota bacterium]
MESIMRSRPRTAFKKALKERRCPKCGAKLNTQRTRCKRCAQVVPRPKKKK